MNAPGKYISPLNIASIRPPYVATNARIHAGWIEARRGALQALLDQSVNRVAPDRYRFISPLSNLLYTGVYIPEMRSDYPLDKVYGAIPQADISFWILTFGGRIGEELSWRLRWLPTFMFVDDIGAVIGGRERLGFPKVHAQLAATNTSEADPGLRVEARAMRALGPGHQLEYQRIFEIAPAAAPAHRIDMERAEEDWRAGGLEDGSGVPGALMAGLRLPQMSFPVLVMRQLADGANPDRALYRGLEELDMDSLVVHRGGWIGEADITFDEPATHRLAQMHGMLRQTRIHNAIWLVQDFVTQTSRPLD
jgi:hypothetical protein